MSTPAKNLAEAALAALTEALKTEGLPSSPEEVLRLLTSVSEEQSGLLTVTIASPSGDVGSSTQTIAKSIERKTGKSVVVRQIKDASLIGGAVVSYGDECIDLSVKRSLEDAELLLSQPS